MASPASSVSLVVVRVGAATIHVPAAVARKNSRHASTPRVVHRGVRRIKGKGPIRRAVRIEGRGPTQVRRDGADVTSAVARAAHQARVAVETVDRRDCLRLAAVFDRYPLMVRATIVTEERF